VCPPGEVRLSGRSDAPVDPGEAFISPAGLAPCDPNPAARGQRLVDAPLLVNVPPAAEPVDKIHRFAASGLEQQRDTSVIARPDLGCGAIEMIKCAIGSVVVEDLLQIVPRLLDRNGVMGAARLRLDTAEPLPQAPPGIVGYIGQGLGGRPYVE
jgi:hypothetical protein